ncbi:hypothetical protein, partial [Oleiphilus sp. HI0066]|uniref:hypothetical protein n=3 Tax=Oleiphilus TaxID=141450 RepID=UPI000A642121
MIKNRLSTFILMPFFMVVITTSLNAAPAIKSITNVDPSDGREVFELTGSGYGFKAQAAPVIYDFGDYAFENGVYNDHQSSFADDFGIPRPEKDPDTLWVKASNEYTTPTYLTHDNARVAGGTRNYRWGGPNSFLGWPRAYGGLTPPSDNEKLYMSWWFRTDYDQHEYYEFGFNNLIGSFDKGEKVTFQGTSVEAFVLGITDKQIALQITDSGGLKGLGWNGIDLLGNSSGATLTTNTIISSGGWWLSGGHGSTKFIRVWEDSAGKDGLRLSWTQDQLTTAGNDSQLRT